MSAVSQSCLIVLYDRYRQLELKESNINNIIMEYEINRALQGNYTVRLGMTGTNLDYVKKWFLSDTSGFMKINFTQNKQ